VRDASSVPVPHHASAVGPAGGENRLLRPPYGVGCRTPEPAPANEGDDVAKMEATGRPEVADRGLGQTTLRGTPHVFEAGVGAYLRRAQQSRLRRRESTP
jgi:hypothetical protein